MFEEEKHPRDESGKFTDKNGSYRQNASYEDIMTNDRKRLYSELAYDLSQVKDIKALLGKEYTGYKGQAAIDKLLEEKQGHIKAAFHRDDIGDIDLIWGNDMLGLQHIIKQRTDEMRRNNKLDEAIKTHVDRLMNNLSETIETGDFRKINNRGNYEIKHNKFFAIIAPTYHKNKLTYVLTTYERK